MRLPRLPLIAATLLLTTPLAAQREPLFRFAALANDTVRLGEPIGALMRFASSPSDTVISIPAGEFGGADALQVRLRQDGIVSSMLFVYDRSRDMRWIVDAYLGRLGQPTRTARDSVGGSERETWVWEDGRTDFRLFAFSEPVDGVNGGALMEDRGGTRRVQ